MKKLILILLLVTNCNTFAFTREPFKCGIDFNKLPKNPFITMEKWVAIKASDESLTTSLATIWKNHPAVRVTMLETILNDGIVFRTSSNFNMVKHFTKNPNVAMEIVIRRAKGCFRTIRVEGTVSMYDTKDEEYYLHEQSNTSEKSLKVFYKVKPNWVQLTSHEGHDGQVYLDMEYTMQDGKWKSHNMRAVYYHFKK